MGGNKASIGKGWFCKRAEKAGPRKRDRRDYWQTEAVMVAFGDAACRANCCGRDSVFHVLNRGVGRMELFSKEHDSINWSGMWNVTHCTRIWSSVPRLGGGVAFGDGRRARRNRGNCSAIGWWFIRRTGAVSSTNRKPRPSWRRLAVAWPAASPTEASRGSAERRNNWDWKQRCEHPTARERGRIHDSPNKRACPPVSARQTARPAAPCATVCYWPSCGSTVP